MLSTDFAFLPLAFQVNNPSCGGRWSMLGEKYPHLLILKEFIKLCERSPTWVSVQSISLTTSDNNAEVSCYAEPFSQKDCFFGGVSCC